MSINISDRNGRALEFAIVNLLLSNVSNITPIGNTLQDQQRDMEKFLLLPDPLKNRFIDSAHVILRWLESREDFKTNKICIERLSDHVAKNGDVTDIRISCNRKEINLSIKHNHRALKHQRPGALPAQCGFSKTSQENINYKNNYSWIIDKFKNNSYYLNNSATQFSELKSIDNLFIERELYSPICDLVVNFLNTSSYESYNSQIFFDFIVGVTNYHKIIVYEEKVDIYEFADKPDVYSLQATKFNSSYVDVNFSNGWNIRMRLHTASSRIHPVSLKFDTQLLGFNVQPTTISY